MGKLIVFEGIDGAGKTTQRDLLSTDLTNRGISHICVSAPDKHDWLCKKLREILLTRQTDQLSMFPVAELLLFAAAAAQVARERIFPALREGKWVLADRIFSVSGYAYQYYAQRACSRPQFDALVGFAGDATWLDLIGKEVMRYIFLDAAPEDVLQRKAGVAESRFESEAMDFHRRLREGYHDFFGFVLSRQARDTTTLTLDALEPIEDLHQKILTFLEL